MRATGALAAASRAALSSASEVADPARPQTAVSATAMLYALRNEPNFGLGDVGVNHGALRLEARYNDEAQDSRSLLIGRKCSGSDELSYEVTRFIGAVFGSVRGIIRALLASKSDSAFKPLDVEACPLSGD